MAVVTLNRPDVYNAFNEVMQSELRELWQGLKTNDEVRSIVLTGSGQKAFCTGIDRADVPTEEGEYYFDALTYDDPSRSIGPAESRFVETDHCRRERNGVWRGLLPSGPG